MNKIKQYIEEREREFDKFTCIQTGCDGNGSIAEMGQDGEWEQGQCQFCDEYLIPMREYHSQTIKGLLDVIVENLDEKETKLKTINKYEKYETNTRRSIRGNG